MSSAPMQKFGVNHDLPSRSGDREYQHSAYAKTMVVDDEILISMCSIWTRGANLNTECFVKVQSAEMASKVVRYFDLEIQPTNA